MQKQFSLANPKFLSVAFIYIGLTFPPPHTKCSCCSLVFMLMIIHDNEWMNTGKKCPGRGLRRTWCFTVTHVCVLYLEGESVLAGAEPHVLHGGAVDHHLSHISAGHKHWAAELRRSYVIRYCAGVIIIHMRREMNILSSLFISLTSQEQMYTRNNLLVLKTVHSAVS